MPLDTQQTQARGDAQERPALRFTRAATEHREPGGLDENVSPATFAAGPTTLSHDVPAHGYLRRLRYLVEASGGAAGGNNAVLQADGPWTFIKSITLKDVNGGHIFGPISGFNWFLVNKWGGFDFSDNPVDDPNYAVGGTGGNFSFLLDIPVEAIARDAFGALPNLNSASTYKVEIVLGDDSEVYSTAPDTLPSVRIRAILDAWTKPSPTDPRGNPQMTTPPFERTTQQWSRASQAVAGAGEVAFKLPRVGNFIRNHIVVFRDAAALREGDGFAESVRLELDGQLISNQPTVILRSTMQEQYGYPLAAINNADYDEAVLVYSYAHDFDGKPGGELRDLWMPTVQSSRLEIILANAGEAGTIEVITNDINVAAGV